MKIRIGITDTDVMTMCMNICKKDRIEASYFCDCLGTYIQEGVMQAGAYSAAVEDNKGRLVMLAGVSPLPEELRDASWSEDQAVGWVLRTNQLRTRTKEEKREVVKVLADLVGMIKEHTPFRKIGNTIHLDQTASLIWMDRFGGFDIDWDTPGVFTNSKNRQGVFVRFSKEI